MKNKILILLFFCLFSVSCNDFLDTWEGYVIENDAHYSHRSGLPPRVVSFKDGRHLVFDARFDPSCLYDPSLLGQDGADINKLYGFTDCNSLIHQNSARFGWRVVQDQKIEIFSYSYSNGKVDYHSMGFTEPNKVDHYEIWAKYDSYYFNFNGAEYESDRSKDCVHGLRVRLYPYFGGNAKAPHRMEIFIYEYN